MKIMKKSFMIKSKKSQAALEFLMTYGWAFLVALGVVGALFYSGIFDFTGLLPNRCEFSAGVSCLDTTFVNTVTDNVDIANIDNDRIVLLLTNNLGVEVEIEECEIVISDGQIGNTVCASQDVCGDAALSDVSDSSVVPLVAGSRWNSGLKGMLLFDDCNFLQTTLDPSRKTNVYFRIQYSAVDSEYSHNLTGLVYNEVVKE